MLRLLLIIWALALAALPASAQTFPSRPITLVVSFAPGGSTSIVARAVADKMGEALGQTVVVENRAGGGGTVGTRQVAKSSSSATPARWRSLPRSIRTPATTRARTSPPSA
jgi:tripartite-type tricarboxylate transporter receptor subunit TctC